MTVTEDRPDTAQAPEKEVGKARKRKEDARLITGKTTWTDNMVLPGMLHIAVVRSPMAHAKIRSIDVETARSAPGVVAVITGRDVAEEQGSIPSAWTVTPDMINPGHPSVAVEEVNHVGEAVAVIAARSKVEAQDAVELVDVDYDPLPVVLDLEDAWKNDADLCHDHLQSNASYKFVFDAGDAGTGQNTDEAFANAEVVVSRRFVQQRLIPAFMEPRSVVVQPQGDSYTMWSSTQIPHILRIMAALTTGIPEHKLRVIAPDVGGGFGGKLQVNPEEIFCLLVAKRLGKPVKWTETRSESLMSAHHGRGQVQFLDIAADREGNIKGLKVRLLADMGAYLRLITAGVPVLGAFMFPAIYKFPAYRFECNGIFTNKVPTDAYRGAGRPEATYAVERAMDALARRVGKDPAEIRELNFIPPFDQATEVASGLQFDSGNYAPTFQKAKELAGYDELRREQQASGGRRDGKLLGVGVSTYIEMCGLAPSQVLAAVKATAGGWEAATIRCHPTGKVTVVTGTSPHGQGHVTTWAQITADALGVGPDDIEVIHGDTEFSPTGMDTYGSRSVSVGGTALYKAAEKIRAKARTIAAHELEVAEEDLDWKDGKFQVAGAPDKAKTIPEIAFSAWTAHSLPADVEPGLFASAVWDPPNFTFPSGAHICVVEVDPDTGRVEIVKYVAVDDCGTIINPMIVDGQVMGGVAQGIAEAMYEEARYDENGTLLTGNMSTYRVPSAAELPGFTLDRTVTPSSTNPMGVKGIGEAGTIASPPAVLNAVADALRPVGVEFIDLPASAERVWRAIQAAEGEAPPEGAAEGGRTGAASMTPTPEGGQA
jgi:aerobic carbon-monoxide dehydrogenase large subunit